MKLSRQMPLLRFAALLLLLLLVVVSCLSGTAAAQVEDDDTAGRDAESDNREDDDEDVDLMQDEVNRRPASLAGVIFPEMATVAYPVIPAGSKTQALIAYRNNQPGHLHTVVLLTGYLSPLNVYTHVIHNFSIVRHARTVLPTETISFQYSFSPDATLEPNDYNLILGLYYNDNVTNNTYFVTAFNNTVTIDESLGTDPKTIMTYLTLLALFGGSGYLLASKVGLLALLKSKRGGGSSRRRVEVGTNGEGYDPEYVSQEHQRYRDAVLQRKSSSSPSKKRL